MQPQPINPTSPGLSQAEIDSLISCNLDEIIRVKGAVERIDNKRDNVAHFYEKAKTAGKAVNICFRNEDGNLMYSHWITDRNRQASERLVDEVVTAVSGDLLRQRCAVFDQPVVPQPQRTVEQLAHDPAEPPRRETPAPATSGNLEWLSKDQLVKRVGIVPAYVSLWTKKNGIDKKRVGKQLLYGLPRDFKK